MPTDTPAANTAATLSPQARSAILQGFLTTDTPLPDIAHAHGLTLEELLDFFDQPETRAALDRYEALQERRTRLRASAATAAAVDSLSRAVAATGREDQSLPAADSPKDLAPRVRAREFLRKSVLALQRLSGAPPTARKPAAGTKSGSEHGPANAASAVPNEADPFAEINLSHSVLSPVFHGSPVPAHSP